MPVKITRPNQSICSLIFSLQMTFRLKNIPPPTQLLKKKTKKIPAIRAKPHLYAQKVHLRQGRSHRITQRRRRRRRVRRMRDFQQALDMQEKRRRVKHVNVLQSWNPTSMQYHPMTTKTKHEEYIYTGTNKI